LPPLPLTISTPTLQRPPGRRDFAAATPRFRAQAIDPLGDKRSVVVDANGSYLAPMATKRKTSSKKKSSSSSSSSKRRTKSRRKKAGRRSTKKSGSRRYGRGASKKVGRAMHEMKRGKLKSGRSGKTVKSRKQAIAIGLSEARREGKKVPNKGS